MIVWAVLGVRYGPRLCPLFYEYWSLSFEGQHLLCSRHNESEQTGQKELNINVNVPGVYHLGHLLYIHTPPPTFMIQNLKLSVCVNQVKMTISHVYVIGTTTSGPHLIIQNPLTPIRTGT